ncbi:MAG: hypothetical protein Q4C95_05240 [Planctomycetia bacterium]|nr:hypothetical protein [Planctomycetia bacterium]
MRYKIFLLAVIVGVACGAGPFRGGRVAPSLFPSVNGPGPGVIANNNNPFNPFASNMQGDAQILFQGADGLEINWDTAVLGGFDSEPFFVPGVQNFQMGKIYRLRLTNLPNRPGVVLYPTLEVAPVTPRTSAYLDHNAIPVAFTDNDFDQVVDGQNFVTKVIFLPSPEFQNLAIAGGVDTIVNTQLPAGADPIVEAQNRGAILAIVRIGNKDLSLPPTNPSAAFGAEMSGSVPQLPISGVNVPAYGTPNSITPYGVPGPAVLPAGNNAGVRQRVFSPVNPMPATEVPAVRESWSGSQF